MADVLVVGGGWRGGAGGRRLCQPGHLQRSGIGRASLLGSLSMVVVATLTT